MGEYLGQIAEHYTQADENILAAAYLERSGDEALRTNAYQPAREAFERSLDLLPPEASGRPTLLVKLGQACCNLADYPAALAALESALAEASQLEDKIQETNALYWLSQVAVKQGEFHKAQGLLADSLLLATAVGGDALARHLYGLGDVAWRLGKPDQAREHVEKCLALARAENYQLLVLYALNRLGAIDGEPALEEKPSGGSIRNEARNGLRNSRGTIAMARKTDPDSADSQFFINLRDNHRLDYGMGGAGYAVFGQVIEGMDVVDRIATVPTASRGGYADVPQMAVVIRNVRVVTAAAPEAAPKP